MTFRMLLLLLLALFTSVGVAFPNVRYVRISASNDAVVLNEIMVYPCGSSTNVALGGTVSSSAFGGSCGGSAATRPASYGNDGSSSCSGDHSNTFCSDQTNAYWQVDLGAIYDVCNVAIILSTTGTDAQNLIFYSSLNTQLMSAGLTGDYAQLATCTSTACTVATKSCTTCTNAGSCNSQATAASGNYPACTCTCNAAYTGAYCTAQLCTNAINCNGHADSVSGYTPSCTCTCNAAWTGAACASSNVCTVAADCNNQASTVSGNRPSCTCVCTAAWTGATCAVSNACTSADCNGHSSSVAGNRPSCTCTCQPAWTDPTCGTPNVCTVAVDCSNQATGVTGNRPSCTCTCQAAWTGSDCSTSNVCTNSADCSSQASAVSGNRPSCSCTCFPEWTGTSCQTSNVCVNSPDCTNHATAVSGNRPACSCTCPAEWIGSSCEISNVCTNAVDCSNQAILVSGNRPSCTCTCQAAWTGPTCSTSNMCTNTPDCNGHASTVTGNRPFCSCTCQPEWTDSTCATSNVCTDSVDCNSRSTAVTGNRPSCTCTCSQQWTGSSCQTSNACTNSVDCNSRATTVGSYRPTCTCTCAPEWTGSSCQTSNVCTNSVDCNNNARVVSGNRPTCTCACKPGISGLHCDYTHTLTRTSSVSLSASSSASPTMSSEGTYSLSFSKVRTVSAPTVTEEPTSSRSASISSSVTPRTQSSEGTMSLTRTQSSDSSRSFTTGITLSNTASESSSKTVPTRTLDISRTQPSLSLTQTASQTGEASLTSSGSLSLSQTPSPTSSYSKSIGTMTRSGTHDASLTRTLSLSAVIKSSTASSSITPTSTISSTNDVSMSGETLTPRNSFSSTHTRPTLSLLNSLTHTKPTGSSEVSVSPTPSAQRSLSWSSTLDKSISRSATESSVGSWSITSSSSLTHGSTTKEVSTTKSSSDSTTSSLSMSMSEELSESKLSTSMSSSRSGPTLSLSVTDTIEKSSSKSATLSNEGGSISTSNSATQSPSLSRGTPELTSSTSLTNEAPSATSSRSVTVSLFSISHNQSNEVTMSMSQSLTSSQSFTGSPTLSYSVTSDLSPSWSLSISLDSVTRDASTSFTQSSLISSSETFSNSYSRTSSSSSSATTSLSLKISPTKQTLSPSPGRTLASLTHDETRSFSSSLSPSWTSTRPPHSATVPIGSPTSTHTLSTGGSASDSNSHSAQSRSIALTQSMSKSLSMTQATHRLSVTISSIKSGSATSSSTSSVSIDFSGTSSVSATLTVSDSTTTSDSVSTSPSPSTSDTQSHTITGSYHTKTATLLIFQPLPFTIGNRPFAWLSDGTPMILAPNGVNTTTGPSLQLFPVNANGLTPTNPYRAPIHVSLADATNSIHATNAQLIGFPLATTPLVLPCSIDGTAALNAFGVPVVVVAAAPQFLLAVISVMYLTLNNTMFSLLVAIAPVNNTEASEGLLWSTWEGGVMKIAHGVPQSLVLRNADSVHAARIVQSSLSSDAIETIPTLTLSAVLLPSPQILTTQRTENSTVTLSYEVVVSLQPPGTDASITHPSLSQLVELWKCMWPTAATAYHQTVVVFHTDALVAFTNPWSRAIEETFEIEWMCTVAANSNASVRIPAVRQDPCTLSCVVPLSSPNVFSSSPLLHATLTYESLYSKTSPLNTAVASVQLWQLPVALSSSSLVGSVVYGGTDSGLNFHFEDNAVVVVSLQALTIHTMTSVTLPTLYASWWVVGDGSNGTTQRAIPLEALHISPSNVSLSTSGCQSVPLECADLHFIGSTLKLDSCVTHDPAFTACLEQYFEGHMPTAAMNVSIHLANPNHTVQHVSDIHVVVDLNCTNELLWNDTIIPTVANWSVSGCPTDAFPVTGRCAVIGGDLISFTVPLTVSMPMNNVSVDITFSTLNGSTSFPCTSLVTLIDVTNAAFSGSCRTPPMPGDANMTTATLHIVSTVGGNSFIIAALYESLYFSGTMSCPFGRIAGSVSVLQECSGNGVCDGNTLSCVCYADASLGYFTGDDCSRCIVGVYGPSCTSRCPTGSSGCAPCSGHGTCDDGILGSGICTCIGVAAQGFWGSDDCNSCSAGYYGSLCTSLCPAPTFSATAPAVLLSVCNQHGTCDDGVYGGGLCNCVTAYQGAACNSCSPGYYGTTCTRCPSQNVSTQPCSGHGSCSDGNQGSGACNCTVGYAGAACNMSCPVAFGLTCGWGVCSAVTGRCACIAPHVVVDLTSGGACSACDAGYWGINCTRICPCQHGTCDVLTGACICSVGYWGVLCSNICPGGASSPCTNHGVCSQTSGNCTCYASLALGYYAGTSCEQCNASFASPSCNIPCPTGPDPTTGNQAVCSNRGICFNGTCSGQCVSGYWGASCQYECPGGAANPCNGRGSCDALSGYCTCVYGAVGAACDGSCQGGFSSPCSFHGLCTATGACQCDADTVNGFWSGAACTTCAVPYSGQNCSVPCDTRTGTVKDRTCVCATGYVGSQCNIACPVGYENDLTPTPTPCTSRGVCSLNPSNDTSAECACVADYYDTACGTYCTVALCLAVSGLLNPQCNTTTGQCECQTNANGNFGGTTCNDCAAGYWGAECSLPCPCNSRGSCDRYTGSCQCAAGVGSGYWTGPACDKCAPGYIGTLCNVWNVEVSEAASAVVSTANSLFPLSGIVLHDPLTEVVLVGSNPLAAFHTTPWESNMTLLQTLNATYPAVAAGFVNATHLWVRLSSNQSGSTISTSSTTASYALLDRRLLAAAAHPVQLTVFNSTRVPSSSTSTNTVNSRYFRTVDTSTTTTETPTWSAVSESGRCAANLFYPTNMTTSTIVVLCQDSPNAPVLSSWSDTIPTQQVQWLGFVIDLLNGENDLLVVTWMTTPSTAATLAWALRVYLNPSLPPNATTVVNTNSSRIPLSGCAEQQGCGIVSHCLVVPPGVSGSHRLLCAAESSLLTANVVVLFVVDLSTGAPGATTSVVIPSADRVSASRSDIDYSLSIFAFRGATTAMLARTVFDGASDSLALLSEYTMSLIQGERSTVLAMTLNATTRTLWLSVATSQAINAVAINLFAIRAVEPYVFDQHGGAVVTVQGVGFVRDPIPICEFQSVNTTANATLTPAQDRPSSSSSPAIFVNSTTLLCVSQEVVVVDGGQCNPVKVNIWYLGRSTSTTLVGSLRPLTATILSVSTTESGGLAMGYYASPTAITLQGFGFVSSATRAACRLENSTSGEILAWWNASALNTTTAICTQRGGAPLSGASGVVRYSHDNATFSNAMSYIVVGPYSHVAAAFKTLNPVMTAAPIVLLPAILLTSVDEYGSPLGLFDTGSASRQLTCLPQNPLFVATTSILTFTTSSTTKVTPTKGTATLDAIVVVAPTTDTTLDASMTSTRFVYCYDILVPLNTVTLSLAIVPGPPVALTLVTTLSGSAAAGAFASGVTSSVVLPTIVIAVVDAVGNYASIETSSALLPLQIVCTYTNEIPDTSGAGGTTASGIATAITAVGTIDPTSGTYSLENLNVQSQFSNFIELAVKPSNISVNGGPLQANAIQSLWIVLPQRPCDSSALFAVSGTFECVECPTYATCDGTTSMVIPSGYWRGSGSSLTLYPCDPASSCPTSLDCAIGYEGPLCGSCSPGYGRTVSSCDACTSVVPQVITAFIVIGVVGIVWALGLRDIAFTAVEDIHSRIVASPEDTKRGPLPIIVKIVVSHLQLLTLLPLSALETAWAVSTAQGSGQWSVVTPSFLNVACVVGRRAHNEMIAVIALFGLALCGCALLSIGLAWLADRSFKKIALKISIRSRAKEIRTSGASPMRYRVADAMITTSHFRRAKHRDRVLRNHRDLLEVYVGDGEKDMEISHIASSTHDKSHIDGGDSGDFTHLFGSAMGDRKTSLFQSATTSHNMSPRRRTSAWFDADLDIVDLEADDILSPNVLANGKQFPRLTPSQQSPLTARSRGESTTNSVSRRAGEENSLPLEDRATITNEQVIVDDLSSKSSQSPPLVKSSPPLSEGKEDSLPLPPIEQRQMPTFSELVEPSRLAQPNLRPPPIMKRVVNLVLVSLVVLAFLLYPTIVQAAQRVITCRTLVTSETTTVSVLSYDPNVDCSSSGYHHWLPISLIVLVLVGAGFPLLCPGAVVIAQYATCAGDSKNARHLFHFVTGGYRVWFWEAIVLFRKAAIVMALVVVGPERDAFQSFSIACSWIFGVSLALNVVLRPWLDEDLGRLELMSLAVLCASSLALAVQSSATPLQTTAVSIIFIAVNGIALLYFLRTMIAVAKGQALDLIESEAPGIHDALQDRSGAIERLRRQCRATESIMRVTNARFANCYELVQFIEAKSLSMEDPIVTASCEGGVSKSSSQRTEVQSVAPAVEGDVFDFDGDLSGLVLPPRITEQSLLHHHTPSALEADFSLMEFDFTRSAHFDAEPQPAAKAFQQVDMSIPSTSVLSHHIDLWDMDIAITPRRPMMPQHPWQLYDDDFDVATLLTAASPLAAARQELRAVPDRKTSGVELPAGNATDAGNPKDKRKEQLLPTVTRTATREDMRRHIQSFHSLAAMLPRTVAAYEADIAVHEQRKHQRPEQQPEAQDEDTEERLHSEQLAAALCEILAAEKTLLADAASFLH